MAFTYSADNLSTDLAKVRRLIGDTDSTNALFTDAEVLYFISTGGSVYMAAALATRAIAASKALLAKRLQISTYEEDWNDAVGDLLKQAQAWEQMASQASGATSVTRVDAYSNTISADTV